MFIFALTLYFIGANANLQLKPTQNTFGSSKIISLFIRVIKEFSFEFNTLQLKCLKYKKVSTVII